MTLWGTRILLKTAYMQAHRGSMMMPRMKERRKEHMSKALLQLLWARDPAHCLGSRSLLRVGARKTQAGMLEKEG